MYSAWCFDVLIKHIDILVQGYYKVNFIFCAFAAFFTGLSGGYAFAQNDSVSPAATSEQTEGNATGLQRIEDGSVVSNEHTVKWRIFTDNGRDFFQKASNILCLAPFGITFRSVELLREPSFYRFHVQMVCI